MDNLIICARCGSDACYVDEVNQDIKTYFCYGCGFQTNSLMKDGDVFYERQLEILHELYKGIEIFSESMNVTIGYYLGGMKEDKLKESESKTIILATYAKIVDFISCF